jgi:hypothetical protein
VILWNVKDPYSIKEILTGKIHGHVFPSFSCFATRCLLITMGELWWMNQEWLELKWGSTVDQ